MKTIKRTIAKIVKVIMYSIIIAIAVYALFAGYTAYSTIEVQNTSIPQKVEEVITPKSDTEQAKEMLAEATAKLNAEEEKLLTEIADIKAKSDAEIAEREAKISDINTIRSSF